MRGTLTRESKKRSVIKAIGWRIIAIANSFLVLLAHFTDDPLSNALIMNLTGFIVYYFYERLCNKVSWGLNK